MIDLIGIICVCIVVAVFVAAVAVREVAALLF
jgi:hypothetical protein